MARGFSGKGRLPVIALCLVGLISLGTGIVQAQVSGLDKTLESREIGLHVTCTNEGSLNTLRIVPSGLEIDNAPRERTIEGTVPGAALADRDADGSPEIYVFAISAGSGSYGSLVAYAANRRKSLRAIHLPPVSESPLPGWR